MGGPSVAELLALDAADRRFGLAQAADLSGDVAEWDQIQDGLIRGQG